MDMELAKGLIALAMDPRPLSLLRQLQQELGPGGLIAQATLALPASPQEQEGPCRTHLERPAMKAA